MVLFIWILVPLLTVTLRTHVYGNFSQDEYGCFEQHYSTCYYPSWNVFTRRCKQLSNPVNCNNGCKSKGYISNTCGLFTGCTESLDSRPVTINNEISIQLSCQSYSKYVFIEDISYVLPTKRINHCGIPPSCTNMFIKTCEESDCACFKPEEDETCKEKVDQDILLKWSKICETSTDGNCVISIARKELLNCTNLEFKCYSTAFPYGYSNCYVKWIKISYSCYDRERNQNLIVEPANNKGINIGVIIGVSVTVVVILLSVILVVLFVFRKKRFVPKHLNSAATFNNNVYNEDLTVSSQNTARIDTHPHNGSLQISTTNQSTITAPPENSCIAEYAVVNKTPKKKQNQPDSGRNNPLANQNDKPPACDFVDNTYYESHLAAGIQHNVSTNIPEDMTENTYYEGSCVSRNNSSQGESSQYYNANNNNYDQDKSEMIENVYYESS